MSSSTVALSALLLSIPLLGQEYASLPSQAKPTPEAAVYRIFLTHVAVFTQMARDAESQGKSGDAWRNHLLHKYGLTITEQGALADTILTYHTQMNDLRAQIKSEAAIFESQYFPGGNAGMRTSQPLPHPPATIVALKRQEDSLTLASKGQIHAMLGDKRFAELDRTVHLALGRAPAKPQPATIGAAQ